MSRRLVAHGALSALLAACHAPPPRPALDGALAELRARPELAGARVGVVVLDGATGDELLACEHDRGFATASNMKLVSAAVALQTLGVEYRAATELWAAGSVANGTLHGDVVLRGHGDPTFGVDRGARDTWAPFVAALRARGVQRITGTVVADDSWLGGEHLGTGWQWDYLDEDYAAPFGALCCHHNCVVVRVAPGPAVTVEPAVLAAPRVQLRQVDAGGATRLTVRRALGSDVVDVVGTIAADARVRTFAIAVPDPAAFAARGLAAALRADGIEVGAAPTATSPGEQLVHTHRSAPYGEWMRRLLTDSDNLYAEVALRCAARVATGDGGSAAAARHAVDVLQRLGVATAGIVVADGSGLSRRNLVQPRQLAALLLALARSAHAAAFAAALPVAGTSGTLRSRLRSDAVRGRVRAKTGFIARVACLSGYLDRPEREPLVFSVMLNDFTCSEDEAKAAIDAFVQRLAAAVGHDDADPASAGVRR